MQGSYLQQVRGEALEAKLGRRAAAVGNGAGKIYMGADIRHSCSQTMHRCPDLPCLGAHLLSKLLLLRHEELVGLLPRCRAQLCDCSRCKTSSCLLVGRLGCRCAAFPLADGRVPVRLLPGLLLRLCFQVEKVVGGIPQQAHDILISILGRLLGPAVTRSAGSCFVSFA